MSAFNFPNQHTNSLCKCCTTSWVVGRSNNIDLGLITTKQFQNIVLFATASDWLIIRWDLKECQSKSYLVIDGNELGHGMKQVFTGEHDQSLRLLDQEIQCSLLQGFHIVTSLLLLHLLPECTWDCPMLFWYFFFFAAFLVDFIMLTDVEMTGWVSASVESLSLPFFFDEFLIVPVKVFMSPLSSPRFVFDDLLAHITPPTHWHFDMSVFHVEVDRNSVGEDKPEITCHCLLHVNFGGDGYLVVCFKSITLHQSLLMLFHWINSKHIPWSHCHSMAVGHLPLHLTPVQDWHQAHHHPLLPLRYPSRAWLVSCVA